MRTKKIECNLCGHKNIYFEGTKLIICSNCGTDLEIIEKKEFKEEVFYSKEGITISNKAIKIKDNGYAANDVLSAKKDKQTSYKALAGILIIAGVITIFVSFINSLSDLNAGYYIAMVFGGGLMFAGIQLQRYSKVSINYS
jgi:transcription elongation factor Elf1